MGTNIHPETINFVPDSGQKYLRIDRGESNSEADFNELRKVNLEELYAEDFAKKKSALVRDRQGVWQVVNLTSMKPARARQLLETVIEEGVRSDDALMRMIIQRFNNVGIKEPAVEVRFSNLTVTADANEGSSDMPTLGQHLHSLFSALNPVKIIKSCSSNTSDASKITILNNISGTLTPGKLTLLLGPPGSGKSTLLRTLAGQIRPKEEGVEITFKELTYNGQNLDTFIPVRTSAYIPQRDNHYAELTVEQTFDFAGIVQGPGAYGRHLQECEAREAQRGITPDPNQVVLMEAVKEASGAHHVFTPIMLSVLGLEGCKDTVVGGPLLRGISGGQRKRVTTGEMAMGSIRTAFMDEISTGLDSATTVDIVKALKEFATMMDGTLLVALLQPPPEAVALFDEVILLGEGSICYQGRVDNVKQFFEGLGFYFPCNVALADALQEIVVRDDQVKYWPADSGQPFKPLAPSDIAAAFRASQIGAEKLQALEQKPFEPREGCNAKSLETEPYGLPPLALLKSVMRRGMLLEKAGIQLSIFRIAETIFAAFLTGTVFINQEKNSVEDGNMFLAVAFFSISFICMNTMADGTVLIERLPPFYRQRNVKFFPAWTFALTTVVLRLPWILADSFIWSIIVYWAVGFVSSARFLVFWLTLFATAAFGLTLFCAIASIARAQTTNSAINAFLILILMNTAGYVINPLQIQGGWIGAYWANPWAYWLRALGINEFTSADWKTPFNGTTLGEAVLNTKGYSFSFSWVWGGILGWGIGAAILNFIVFVWALTYLSPLRGPAATVGTSTSNEKSSTKLIKVDDETVVKTTTTADVESGLSPIVADTTKHKKSNTNNTSAVTFTPLAMTFKDLKYSVTFPGGSAPASTDATSNKDDPHAGQLLLLKGITGAFRPGILTALMGASGAGKTTLLDCLAGRKTSGLITGDIRVNGHPKEHATFAKVSGYVEQEDIHEPVATVHEALQFSARLRLSSSLPAETVEAFVNQIEELVELTPIKDAAVGMPGVSGLSVEQRKRLTLAVELVANPSIVFLDEPTSGLDARGAAMVMRAITNVAKSGRSCVCTIHQPSANIFEAFNELLLLKRGGETIFFGPLGGPGAPKLISYLESLPKVPAFNSPGQSTNPANYMLDVSSPDAEAKTGENFAQLYTKSDLAERNISQVDEYSIPPPDSKPLDLKELGVAPWGRQFKELLRRDLKSYNRNLSYNLTRLVICLAIAICYGTLYQGQGTAYDTANGIFNIAGAIFASTLFLGVINAMMVQEVTSNKRAVFYREHAASYYSYSAFALSESVVEIPYLFGQAVVYCLIVYFAIGFAMSAAKFFWFFVVMLVVLGIFTIFGQLLVHMTPNLALASATFSFCLSALQLFSGFLKPYAAIPVGWKWAYWINPLSYTIYALVGNQLCDITSLTTLPDGITKMPVKEYVKQTFGFKQSFVYWTLLILFAFMLAGRVAAFACLKYLNYQRR